MKPVIAGPTMPARFPTQFWNPTQRPDAVGPANVWPTAYSVAEAGPKAAPARRRHTDDASGGAQTAPTRHMANVVWLAIITVLYARFGVAPLRIQRSIAHPAANAPPACIRYTAPPNAAMRAIENPRSCTRYSGSQLMTT